jgi:hypothetical protein
LPQLDGAAEGVTVAAIQAGRAQVAAQPREQDADLVAVERHAAAPAAEHPGALLDQFEAGVEVDRRADRPAHRSAEFQPPDQRLGPEVEVSDRRARPGVQEARTRRQAVQADLLQVPELQHLLLVEVQRGGRAEIGEARPTGEAEEIGARVQGFATELLGAVILDIRDRRNLAIGHLQVADHFPGGTVGRAQLKLHVKAGHIVGEEQDPLGLALVERIERLQLLDARGQGLAIGRCLAAHPDVHNSGGDHLQTKLAGLDFLRRDLDGRDIARFAQGRVDAVADIADHAHRLSSAGRFHIAEQGGDRLVQRPAIGTGETHAIDGDAEVEPLEWAGRTAQGVAGIDPHARLPAIHGVRTRNFDLFTRGRTCGGRGRSLRDCRCAERAQKKTKSQSRSCTHPMSPHPALPPFCFIARS